MEFQEVIKEAGRCCAFYKHNCEACSLTNVCPARFYIDKYINVGDYTYFEGRVMDWVKEHPKPQYPTWIEWLSKQGLVELKEGQFVKQTKNEYTYECKTVVVLTDIAAVPIPADIAEKLGIEPEEGA